MSRLGDKSPLLRISGVSGIGERSTPSKPVRGRWGEKTTALSETKGVGGVGGVCEKSTPAEYIRGG